MIHSPPDLPEVDLRNANGAGAPAKVNDHANTISVPHMIANIVETAAAAPACGTIGM